jgi:hypothetical protein
MKGAIIIAAVLVVIGLVIYLDDLRRRRKGEVQETIGEKAETETVAESSTNAESSTTADDTACCGQHLICEKQNNAAIGEIEYYDDEELDDFKGRQADSYTEEEIEMFRDIVLTLRREDAVGWSVSLERRGIQLPAEVRDELLLLLQ